jgi:hypothetical protein
MDFDRFSRLLKRMEQSNVASAAELVGCSKQEVERLEARYGIRLPQSFALYLRMMGHKSGRLFTCDHMAVFYKHVLEMTADERQTWEECRVEFGGGPPPQFELPADALLIAGRLGDQFQFIRCTDPKDSPVWYFNNWEWQVRQTDASVVAWLEGWCEEAEQAIAQGYFDDHPEGTRP